MLINFLKYEEKSYSFNKSLSQNKNHSLLQVAIKIQIQHRHCQEMVSINQRQIELLQKLVITNQTIQAKLKI